ncbi:phospholipase [Tistrella mobilis]
MLGETPGPAMDDSQSAVIVFTPQLFSPGGVEIAGDGTQLTLFPEGGHTVKYWDAGRMPEMRGPTERFEGGEHTAIGDQVILYFSPEDAGTPAWQVPLRLANGLQLTYGQIVALGGDFYGLPDRPIADGITPEDRVARFTDAFNSLAVKPDSHDEALKILQVMQTEIDAAQKAMREGQEPHVAYDALGDKLSIEWNKITGGSTVPPRLGRYLRLALTNWDHFGVWAVAAYTAGHTAALQQAVKAGRTGRREDLVLAYAMNAFADHYLSDLFSAGHLRTPRRQLYYGVIGPVQGYLGSQLSRYMHDEDCKFGLDVQNAVGDRWRAYGDKRYFDTIDVGNRNRVNTTVQASADEIWEACNTGSAVEPQDFAALSLIPDLTTVTDHLNRENYAALFYAGDNTIYRRNTLSNLNDHSWTKNWVGAATLAQLLVYKPNNPAGYLDPPAAAPVLDPDGWQSRTPVPPQWVDGNRVRYAFSWTNDLNQSYIGPWSGWITLQGAYFPTLIVPVDPTGRAAGRNLFRQFEGGLQEQVGSIDDNVSTRFVDNVDMS